jgi:hypothetical protein
MVCCTYFDNQKGLGVDVLDFQFELGYSLGYISKYLGEFLFNFLVTLILAKAKLTCDCKLHGKLNLNSTGHCHYDRKLRSSNVYSTGHWLIRVSTQLTN